MSKSSLELDVAPPFDHLEALRRFGDCPDAFAEIVYLFLDYYPREFTELREAIDREDVEAASMLAHKIQGALANLAAHPARRMASGIEKLVEKADFAKAAQQAERLDEEVARVSDAVRLAVTQAI